MSKFEHECIDWDGLLIDINSPEIECCTCYSDVVNCLWDSFKETNE